MQKKKLLLITLIAFAFIGYSYYISKNKPAELSIKDISQIFSENPTRDYSGVLLANLDNESDNEIFVSVVANKNIFFKFKDKKLFPLAIPELEEEKGNTFSVTACDIDQDGRDELLIINSGSQTSRIMKFIKTKWTDLITDKSDPLLAKLSNAYSATCIDRMGDGKFGFAVASNNGPILYLELIGSKVVDMAKEIGLNFSSQGRSILGVPGPTGHTNIFVGNLKSNFYFVNNGNGVFTNKAEEYRVVDTEFETRGITLIDLNHDEVIDLAYGNRLGPMRLMQQERMGSFKNVTPDNLARNYAVNALVVEDLNLDGHEDIYLNNMNHKNELFLGSSDTWTEVDLGKVSEKDDYGVSTVVADIDKNGSFEILNTHGNGKESKLTLYTIAPVGKWIKIKPELPNKGIPRGSVVTLKTSQRSILKSVSTGSGRFANYDDVLTFGLLENEKPIAVQILMPSGKIITQNEDLKILETNIVKVN